MVPCTSGCSKERQTSTFVKILSIKIANVGICREVEVFC